MSDSTRHKKLAYFGRLSTLLLLVLVLPAVPVNAYDQQISSTLFAEGYSVYRTNGTRISRRRFVEDLSLGAWNILPGESDAYYKGPRLSVNLSFRIIGDAGIAAEETTARYENSYIPGVRPITMQAVTAYIDGHGFWGDTLDVRAGRQIRLDTLGFFAFDGIDTRLRLPISIDLSTYIGLDVRGGKHLGYDAFELDGTDRGSRSGMEQEQYPDRTPPNNRLAMGMEMVFFPWRWIEAAAAFRAVGVNEGADNLADERVGGRLGIHHGAFRANGRMVYSPMVNVVSEGDAELGVSIKDQVAVLADFHRFVPVFEGDSIFNVFDLEPQNDLGGRVTVDIGRAIDLAAWGFTRIADGSGGISGEEENSAIAGVGGGIGGNYRTPFRDLSARITYVTEWGERRFGTELRGGHAFLRNRRLWLFARFSYFRVDDDFSSLYSGNIFGYILSARFDIAEGLRILAEFEHYLGDHRSSRMTALALLELDLWR